MLTFVYQLLTHLYRPCEQQIHTWTNYNMVRRYHAGGSGSV